MNTTIPFKQQLRTLQVIFFSILLTKIFLCVLVWWFQRENPAGLVFQDNNWLYISLSVVVILAFVGRLQVAKFLNTAKEQENLAAKLAVYRKAKIAYWAIREFATVLLLVFFYVCGSMVFLFAAAIETLSFASSFPHRDKVIEELELDDSDIMLLDDTNA